MVGAGLFGGAGTGSGDYDFFRVEATAGQNITVDVDTPILIDGLDSTVSISSIAGIELLFDDDDGETFDTLASFAVPATGTCYVVIYGFPGNIIADPFDSSSGTGFGSEAVYTAIIEVTTLEAAGRDYYSFDLAAGDIIRSCTTISMVPTSMRRKCSPARLTARATRIHTCRPRGWSLFRQLAYAVNVPLQHHERPF